MLGIVICPHDGKPYSEHKKDDDGKWYYEVCRVKVACGMKIQTYKCKDCKRMTVEPADKYYGGKCFTCWGSDLALW